MPYDKDHPPTYRELLDSRKPEHIDVADAIVWSHLEASWVGEKVTWVLAALLIAALAGAGWYAINYAQ